MNKYCEKNAMPNTEFCKKCNNIMKDISHEFTKQEKIQQLEVEVVDPWQQAMIHPRITSKTTKSPKDAYEARMAKLTEVYKRKAKNLARNVAVEIAKREKMVETDKKIFGIQHRMIQLQHFR